jgi:signal transduction histidine kinase/CheY-like chemotaxis protein
MTPLRPDPSNPIGSIARTLYDIGQGFDSPLETEPRLRRALRLLRRIVPYDHCALLEAPEAGAARLVVEPDAPEIREAVSRVLTRFLTVLTDEPPRAADWLPPDLAHLVPCASHLAVPLVGLDRALGVLFVSYREVDAYTDDHLRLLSVVASQIAAFLTACWLREQEAQIVSEHEAARAAAEAGNRARDEFLAMLGHELRTPLMGIRITMQTIRGQAERDPDVQRASDAVERQIKHLARLLDDLLDVSRLTRGKIELRKETGALQVIVAEALEATRSSIDIRRHVVSVSLADDPLWFEADPTRITQVVANLLDNAAKYTPPGGEISVTGYGERGEVVLRVRDTGIGISPEMLPRIFDLFAQVDRSPVRSEGGLGVGLTLARMLIELHGGTIIGQSEGLGRGSEFVLRLPVGAPVLRGRRDDSRPVAAQARHILLVEDDDNVRKALHRILTLHAHRVQVARDGPEGVEIALAAVPEVVFIDIGLPGIDGYEVGRRIRAALGKQVLLVALTAYGQEEDHRRSSEAGFDAHLVKPVSYQDLSRLLGPVGPMPDSFRP